jgi:hypothetical protein
LTEDLPFDSYQILCQLKDHASQNGGNFHRCSVEISDDRFTISPVRDTGYYRIEEPSGFQAEAQIVVCAAGVLNSVIFNRIVGGSDKNGMKLREFLVTVLHQRICNRILFMQNPLNSGFLSLVPFISGTTISSNLLCRNITNVRDTAFTGDASEEHSSMIAERLTKFTPGMVGNASIGTHFYVCQRLINTAHDTNRYLPCTYSDYHYFWIETPKNIFYFYPGLFTLAPVGAQKLATYLSERLDKKQIRRIGSGPMDVSHRPYFNRVTHIARTTSDKLRFEKIEG